MSGGECKNCPNTNPVMRGQGHDCSYPDCLPLAEFKNRNKAPGIITVTVRVHESRRDDILREAKRMRTEVE